MRTRTIFRWLVLVVFALFTFSTTGEALAQRKEARKEPTLSRKEVADLLSKLASNEETELNIGLEQVRGTKGAGKAVETKIVERLEQGLPPRLAEAAIDVLAEMDSSASAQAVANYAAHRDPVVRRSAVRALARVKGPAAVTVLRRALGDQDPQVRGFAASSLGALGGHEAFADLVLSLDRRNLEAATAIGQVCLKEECGALTKRLGKLPFDVMTGAATLVLYRKAAEVPDSVKLAVVDRIRDLASPEATKLLTDLKAKRKGLSPAVLEAIDEATKGAAQ